MEKPYWLNTTEWSNPPQDLKDHFDGKFSLYSPERTMCLGADQFAHTSTSPAYKGFNKLLIPWTVEEMWKWMITGEGVSPYSRPPHKRGLYDGRLEETEKVPSQCMTTSIFCTSLLKHTKTPARVRVGFTPIRRADARTRYVHHNVLEYRDGNSWQLRDPSDIDREFIHSYRAIEMIEKKEADATDFLLPNGEKGVSVLIKAAVEDFSALFNNPVVPWRFDRTYRGININSFVLGGAEPEKYLDLLTREFFDMLKDPVPEELEKMKRKGIVSCELRKDI